MYLTLTIDKRRQLFTDCEQEIVTLMPGLLLVRVTGFGRKMGLDDTKAPKDMGIQNPTKNLAL